MSDDHRTTAADPTRRFLREIALLVTIAVVVAMVAVYARTAALINEGALGEARSYAGLIVATRSWNALHDGVWVVKGPGVETNPYLIAMGVSADATTTDGRVLTLRNPAVMTREISSLLLRSDGATFHLTSLKPVNPANAPDPWERSSLLAFNAGVTERWISANATAGPELRYMRPLVTDASCLVCHARQGYRVGDIRGAISVVIPLARQNGQAAINALILGLLGLAATAVLLTITLTLVRRMRSELRKAQAALVEAATIDHLTKASNRRNTLERLAEEIERARRTREPLGLLMADIDHFKNINDELGHAAGDGVLLAVTQRITAATRPYDLVGRIGGEEFLVVAPNADLEGATSVAERARSQVSGTPIEAEAHEVTVTISLGVTLVDPDEIDAVDRALARVDAALYDSKGGGRDRVSVRLRDDIP
jgi:diguanylate cyclase (GGDEF)-like protein